MAQFPRTEAEIAVLAGTMATGLPTAAAEQATAAKNEALQALTDDMKADLRYAETTVNYDDDQLKLIGWGGRAAKTSLEAPGQTRSFEASREGGGWVFLDWQEPVTAARSRLTRSNAACVPTAPGPTPEWPSKAKSRSRTRNAARNGNTVSSPSTKPEKANPATPSWRCCDY